MTRIQILLKQVAGKPYALERRMASLSKCLPITVQDLIYPSWLCYWNRSRPNNCLITAVIVIFKSTALRFATMSSLSRENLPGAGARRATRAGGGDLPACRRLRARPLRPSARTAFPAVARRGGPDCGPPGASEIAISSGAPSRLTPTRVLFRD